MKYFNTLIIKDLLLYSAAVCFLLSYDGRKAKGAAEYWKNLDLLEMGHKFTPNPVCEHLLTFRCRY